MCELIGINAARPYAANAELFEFYQHSVRHPHGWGLSWRNGSDVQIYKGPERAVDSTLLQDDLLNMPIEQSKLIGHIRKATHGVASLENCHPFLCEDVTGREWLAAHNGIMFNESLLAGYDNWEEGQTDSERIFLFLMDVLSEAYVRRQSHDFNTRFAALASALSNLSNGNRVNVLLDDGKYLYIHTNTMAESLYFLQLEDTVLVSTTPLDERPWQPVPRCRLLAFQDGRLVKQSAPHNHVFVGCNLDSFKFSDQKLG